MTRCTTDRMPTHDAENEAVRWCDGRAFAIEGSGWDEGIEWGTRLPDAAREAVGEKVWNLSRQSAGLYIRFHTNAMRIHARWRLRFAEISHPHLAATAMSGLDLYVREQGQWRWVGNGRPIGQEGNQALLLTTTPTMREYLLYFPLYNGLDELLIGIDGSAEMTPVIRTTDNESIVFYGTSIVQGACASRPGMTYPAIIGRRLDCKTINLGFSDAGPMRPEIVPWLGQLKPSAFVIDSLPNMKAHMVTANAATFVEQLRLLCPDVPIVLVENIVYQQTMIDGVEAAHVAKNKALRAAYHTLKKRGIRWLHYVAANDLLGNDWDATVDGTHLTDLGFHRMAYALAPIIAHAIRKGRERATNLRGIGN